MKHDRGSLAARAAPAIFVVLWSTGFIATKYVVNNADPLTYLGSAWRWSWGSWQSLPR